ncbi:hypothetical protein ACFFSQ_39235 [Dactylosporangium matsuzakiense]|uniref:hypothetical protein n=1 Tax=Dactylosporangium matsuzakiense TaxID=53360 RepID=UPI0035ED60D0
MFEVIFVDVDGRCGLPLPQPGVAGMLPRSASTLLPISIDIEGRGHCKRRLGSVLSARPGPIHGCAVFIDVEGRCGAAIGVDALTNFDRHRRRR